jgi:hypothetical protein
MYEMRCITTIKMLQGGVVHEVIADALRSAQQGTIVDVAELKKRVTDLMWNRFSESSERLWEYGNRPAGRKQGDITNLLEHYYGFPDALERARDARNCGWQCVENLLGSDLWKSITASDREGWREIDEHGFPSFDLDGIMTYAKVDFAYHDGCPIIIDWKTGQPGADGRTQLTLYSLYAQSKWGWKPEQTRLMAVYLHPELKVEEFTPTLQDVEATEETVKRSFAQMLEMEPAYGPADIADFPISEDTWHCKWCRFQGICEGARRNQPGATESEPIPEPPWEW